MIFDIVASNVSGLGAVQVVQSLLPAFERVASDRIDKIWLPASGPLRDYSGALPSDHYVITSRVLPNSVSRVMECLIPSQRYLRDRTLLVLGDLPFRHSGKQIVFVHQSHLIKGSEIALMHDQMKFSFSRAIFSFNVRYVDRIIVQTEAMQTGLNRTFPNLNDKIDIIPQPAPDWLLQNPVRREGRAGGITDASLKLFYPSAVYPHKNHELIFQYAKEEADNGEGVEISLTCDRSDHQPQSKALKFLGRLDPSGMQNAYSVTDALLFPSLEESYGLPLIEAMTVGLPILCADKPYARSICADQAIYFDPKSTVSLRNAISQLKEKLANGYWPNWSDRIGLFPRTWDEVAVSMLSSIGN
ncbi:MAG: glycosyltransferase [Parasphingorhabdus sp.]